MKTKIQRSTFLLFFLFFLSCSSVSAMASMMTKNPFNLTTESSLSNNYNPEIRTFWQAHARAQTFLGVDNKIINTVSIKNGNDKVVVFSQGRNESVLKYQELAFDLHKQGYDIFLIDHRGQGFSERFGGDQHRGYVKDFQDYVSDFNQYVNSLQLEKKYTHRYLLSHSMGGAISALYLQQYPHPFQSSVFFSPMLSINFGPLPRFLAIAISNSSAQVCEWFSDIACYIPTGKGYVKQFFDHNNLTHSEKRFYAGQHHLSEYPTTQLGDPTMRWIANSIKATNQAIENANKINIPVLLIQAGSDKIVTSEGQNTFFANLKKCKLSQLLTIAGAKHEILLERDDLRLPALTRSLQFFKKTRLNNEQCPQE